MAIIDQTTTNLYLKLQRKQNTTIVTKNDASVNVDDVRVGVESSVEADVKNTNNVVTVSNEGNVGTGTDNANVGIFINSNTDNTSMTLSTGVSVEASTPKVGTTSFGVSLKVGVEKELNPQ